MSDQDGLKQRLLDKIKARRNGINTYASELEKRGIRMTNLSIILTAITAALTAGPALGGTRFTNGSSRLANAQSTGILLEKLEMSLEFDQVSLDDATKQYQEYCLSQLDL